MFAPNTYQINTFFYNNKVLFYNTHRYVLIAILISNKIYNILKIYNKLQNTVAQCRQDAIH